MEQKSPVLQVQNLQVTVHTAQGEHPLIKSLHFKLESGRILGLVGESGCGKTVTSLAILQMLDPKSTTIHGSICLNGKELNGLKPKEMQHIRGKEIALIMQNPMNAFSPVSTIGSQFIETIRTHMSVNKAVAKELAITALEELHLPHPQELLRRYPFELSGGMLQRVMIALTMVLKPSVIIADEPTTALDVKNQRQVLHELDRCRQEYGAAILLISHDLGVIAELADEVAVMQQGMIVEQGDVYELFDSPKHAYTSSLLAARPTLSMK
jgi:nickel transport system ATP-binding protein